ncbi:MAG: hypothetical protein AAFZ15_24635 [Bacteroidota bacterium]
MEKSLPTIIERNHNNWFSAIAPYGTSFFSADKNRKFNNGSAADKICIHLSFKVVLDLFLAQLLQFGSQLLIFLFLERNWYLKTPVSFF